MKRLLAGVCVVMLALAIMLTQSSAPEAQTASLRFASFGDYGSAARDATNAALERDVANLVKSWNPDVIITLGDNNYETGQASTIDTNVGQFYASFIFPYQGGYCCGGTTNRFFPSLGNHDWNPTAGVRPYTDYFTLPGNERYYDFVRGPVHFFAVDSDTHEPDGVSSTSVQANWLRTRLAASTAPWKVVYFHHAPYTSGEDGQTPHMRWPFASWGASLVLAAHSHNYERLNIGGLTYIVNGLGGAANVDGWIATPVSGSVRRYNSNWGAQQCDTTSTSLTCRFINRAGTVIDTFTLGTSITPTATPTATPRPRLTPTPTPTSTPTPPTGSSEITPGASGVTASTHDGNVPGNTVDGSLSTRWSANGDGAWIRYDLGTPRAIAYVKIAVYNGNSRQNRFDLQVSDDLLTWQDVLAGGITSGTTTAEQTHDFPDVTARYLRYVGHGSTVGTFNSVTEVSLFAPTDGTPIPSATPTPTAQTPTPTPGAFSGYYRLMARHSGKAVAVQSASTANAANIFQWTYTPTGPSDEWLLTSLGGGYYTILARHSGKAMVVQSASTAEGANVFQWAYGGTQTNDEWAIVDVGSGFHRLLNRHSGKVAEVVAAGTADGTNVAQRTWNGGTHQQFQIVAVP